MSGDKNVHHVLCFDLIANTLTLRDADKGSSKMLNFSNVSRVRSNRGGKRGPPRKSLIDLTLRPAQQTWRLTGRLS